MRTSVQPATSLAEAVAYLECGDLVAFPTETVYGLGADARSNAAVQKIYDAKGRPAGNPIIVHVSDIAHARQCAADWPDIAQRLAEKYWPGPLTLIVPRGPTISPLVSAGLDSVALRCPSHPVAQQLLQKFAGPIAAPSANRSGFTSPTTAAHVFAELSGRIPLILDGGTCDIGVESTVVDVCHSQLPLILRPGLITREMLREFVPNIRSLTHTFAESDAAPSPGLHSRHYAPRHPAFRFAHDQWSQAQAYANQHAPVALISHRDAIILPAPHETIRLPADAPSYAQQIYAALRNADALHVSAILVLMPETTNDAWAAVSDRLHRATQPLPKS